MPMFRSLRLATCLAALLVASSGCGGPFLVVPGGELTGEVVSERVDDWSFLEGDGIFELETRPDDPHVLARFDGRVYPLRAVLVGQPGELEDFDQDRFI